MLIRGAASFVFCGGLTALVCLGQLGPQYPPGGGYPGGNPRYPGGRTTGGTGPSLPRLPGKGKKPGKPTKEQLANLIDLRGMLRRLDDKSVILQADDKRFLQIARSTDTKLLKNNEEAKSSDFVPGDRVIVEAAEDEDNKFFAVRITWDSAGTEKDRAIARGPVPESVRFEDDAAPAESKRESGDGPPKLTRNKGGAGGAATPETPKAPADSAPQAEVPAPVAEPVTREPGTIAVDKVDLEPVPTIKRGRPAPRPRSADLDEGNASPIAVASAATGAASSGAAVPAGAASPPSAPVIPDTQEDLLLTRARESVLNFTEVLPNYMAKQVTTRFQGSGKGDRWQPQDNFTADLVYQDGKESYTNVMLNGKPAKGKIEETGAWSRGEFGTTLRDLFSPATNAAFKPRGSATIVGRKAKYFDYMVEQENSHWQIGVPGQTYFPSYRGSIWIDVETARVLRVEMQGRRIPETFPVDTVESAIDFDFVKIGGGSYLVPIHSETLSCFRGLNTCSKNVIDFRNYRRFGAQSELILNQ
jgi:hypothetical protein